MEQAPSSEPIKKLSPNTFPKNRMTRMATRVNSTGLEWQVAEGMPDMESLSLYGWRRELNMKRGHNGTFISRVFGFEFSRASHQAG